MHKLNVNTLAQNLLPSCEYSFNAHQANVAFQESVAPYVRETKEYKPNSTEVSAWASNINSKGIIPEKLYPTLFAMLKLTNPKSGVSHATINTIQSMMETLKKEGKLYSTKKATVIKGHIKELKAIIAPYLVVEQSRRTLKGQKRGWRTHNIYRFTVSAMIQELFDNECGRLLTTYPKKSLPETSHQNIDKSVPHSGVVVSHEQPVDIQNKPVSELEKRALDLAKRAAEKKQKEAVLETCPTLVTERGSVSVPLPIVTYNYIQQVLPTTSRKDSQLAEVVNEEKEDNMGQFKDIETIPPKGGSAVARPLEQNSTKQVEYLCSKLNMVKEEAKQVIAKYPPKQIREVLQYMSQRKDAGIEINSPRGYFLATIDKYSKKGSGTTSPATQAKILDDAHKRVEATRLALVDKIKAPDMRELAEKFQALPREAQEMAFKQVAENNTLLGFCRSLDGVLAQNGKAEILLQGARDYGLI